MNQNVVALRRESQKSFKETQENTCQQIEPNKEKMRKIT